LQQLALDYGAERRAASQKNAWNQV
jgi:hypothetical protein